MPGDLLGTPLYMAPEQMADPDVSSAADVYSLGLILFEILTLERARDPNAIYAPVDARTSVRAPYRNIAPELETICVKSTEGDPKDRYPTPRAMQEAINRYLEGDRELEQRRHLAAEHVKAARVALGTSTQPSADFEKERGTAITEIGRAIALDPGNTEYFSMLGDLVSAPPDRIPAPVREQLEQENQRVIHVGAKHSATAILSWWLFLPILAWIGFRNTWQAALIAIPGTIAIVMGLVMMRQRRIGHSLQYASIGCMMLASIAVSRIYGPFVLMPSLLTTYAMVLQAHPERRLRMAGALAAAIAIVIPVILEWMGVLPASYVFEAGTWRIVPQLVELPRLGTNVFVTAAHLGIIVVPCLFIARLRVELSRAQTQLAVQAWHWKQLGGQLIGRPDGT
jgi:serine/threonine-protein kinase